MELAVWVARAGDLMEVLGIVAMLMGTVVAAVVTVRQWADGNRLEFFRRQLGRAILLGLEFLVAADIIRSVSAAPTLEGVAVLAAIVLIRTFLSFTLKIELEGRWPWRGGQSKVY